MSALRHAYSRHFLRANREGFTPLTFRRFVQLTAHASAGLTC
jgi:hypothetical protein